MKIEDTRPVRLQDYRPPEWLVASVALTFRLSPRKTRVVSRIEFHPGHDPAPTKLDLDGEGLTLIRAAIDGETVTPSLTEGGLTVQVPPRPFVWEAEVEISPEDNTALEGLYMSGDIYCTQCEAEGFRRITYYPDRPDVLAPFRVRIEGDAPVLLSNGNPVAEGPGWAEWHDPWPKPSYLFALVAGDLRRVSGAFTTMEGRDVDLNIWVRPGDEDRCDHALASLVAAMRWDEEKYGRAYDLDVFNLVAVDEFNAGAMENKGLNIFNSKYVLASPATATDADYEGIESVVAHEYFHNWTGNRVTCRDWFQLCLKEGLTVFRDQQFTADTRSPTVKRISDVMLLRAAQFREDRGPLAHPPRPDTYVEINNFYTTTVYEKGAEIVRMLHRLSGPEGYRAAMDLYFARHDGQAATVEDFFACFQEVVPTIPKGFERWWSQAGTPKLTVTRHWDGRCLTLVMVQENPASAATPEPRPLPLPLMIAVIGSDGRELAPETLIVMKGRTEIWVFDSETGIWSQSADSAASEGRSSSGPSAPLPSMNRGFSAPIILEAGLTTDDYRYLLAFDTDPFNRWDAARRLSKEALVRLTTEGEAPRPDVLEAFRSVLTDPGLDPSFKSLALRLPSDDDIAGTLADAGYTPDPDTIHLSRRAMAAALAAAMRADLEQAIDTLAPTGPYRPDPQDAGRRALRHTALGLLTHLDGPDRARELFAAADNMTDRLGSLAILVETGAARGALAAFYETWHHTPGVIDKWFGIQVANAPPEAALATAERLMRHPDFAWKVPNRVRSVVGAFARNHAGFHRADGTGYRKMAEWILRLDAINPQIAAGLAGAFQTWRRYDGDRRSMSRDALAQIAARETLSRDTRDVVTRITSS